MLYNFCFIILSLLSHQLLNCYLQGAYKLQCIIYSTVYIREKSMYEIPSIKNQEQCLKKKKMTGNKIKIIMLALLPTLTS